MMGWGLVVMQLLGITPIPVSSFSPVLCRKANKLIGPTKVDVSGA